MLSQGSFFKYGPSPELAVLNYGLLQISFPDLTSPSLMAIDHHRELSAAVSTLFLIPKSELSDIRITLNA